MARYEAKTRVEPQGVEAFIASLDSPQRQAEARQLQEIYATASGFAPRLFTGGMIGFGSYAYTYDSGHSGTTFATGFAPRKAELSLYGLKYGPENGSLLAALGKHRQGVSCVYVKHLNALNLDVLDQLIREGLQVLRGRYPVFPE